MAKRTKKRKMGASHLPRQSDLYALFGNPSDPSWGAAHIDHIVPPFKIYFGKLPVRSISINKLVSADLKAILNEIWEAAGKNQAKIHEWGMDALDGSWVVRAIRNGRTWSNHSFAMAVDFDARHNPLGSTKGRFTPNHPVVKIFEKHGVRWGGRYKNRKDPMHFEFVSG